MQAAGERGVRWKRGSIAMPKRRRRRKSAPLGEKEYWHLYSLQGLSPSRFTVVVGKILRGKYTLIPRKIDTTVQNSGPA